MVLKVLPLQPEWWMWRTCGGVCEWQHKCAGHGWKIRGFWLKTATRGCLLEAMTCITLLTVFKVSSVVPAPAWRGGTCEALSHLGPTMLKTYLYVVAVMKDLLVANAGPLSFASFGCRLQGREERGEPPQQWGLSALCCHLGFGVLFWIRKKTQVFQSVKNIQISLLTAQQREVQDRGLQRQRLFSSSVVPNVLYSVPQWYKWSLLQLKGRSTYWTPVCPEEQCPYNPSICAAAELSPNGIYTIYPNRQWSYLLGTWHPRPDFQQEPAAPIALKYWDAITMPAFYPYKIYRSEGEKRNTAPGGILFPDCIAGLGPEHGLDIMKVLAVVMLRFQHEGNHRRNIKIFIQPRPTGVFLQHGHTIFSPLPASVPSLWNLPSEWENAHELPISNFKWQLDNCCLHGVLLKEDNIFTCSTSCGPAKSVCW